MIYLLDASSVITVHGTYYSFDQVPEFWEWLQFHSRKGVCKLPRPIFEEITPSDEKLKLWLRANKNNLIIAREIRPELVQEVVNIGYGEDLSEVELEKIGRDPFLIVAALQDRKHHCVVTNEVSKPSQSRENRRIPDVCSRLNVQCIDTVKFVKSLGFTTNWKTQIPESDLARYTIPNAPELF